MMKDFLEGGGILTVSAVSMRPRFPILTEVFIMLKSKLKLGQVALPVRCPCSISYESRILSPDEQYAGKTLVCNGCGQSMELIRPHFDGKHYFIITKAVDNGWLFDDG